MKHPQHPNFDWRVCFPFDQYPTVLPNQDKALDIVSRQEGSVTLELPTGSGKTAIGYTFLKTLEKNGAKNLYYCTPTKTLVNQVKLLHPECKVVYGRNEYQCLYYEGEYVSADECPCSLLDCSHRVNQDTGEVQSGGAKPCPYLRDKFLAQQGGIVVSTTAFYLFSQLFSKGWEKPDGLVIDEAHRIAQIVRNCLSYEITDYHLNRGIEILEDIGVSETGALKNFLQKMTLTIRHKPKKRAALLEEDEIKELLKELNKIDPISFEKKVKSAIKSAGLYADSQSRDILKKIEVVTRDLVRYYRSLEYSLPAGKREALNYTYAYFEGDEEKGRKAGYRLHIKAYYVAPIVRKILSPRTLAYSATIGDSEVFGFETGIKFPFYVMQSDFPVDRTRIFMPTDTPNLAVKSRRRNDLNRILRRIAKACKTLAEKKLRSLVVVISSAEHQKFLALCQEEGVSAISYGNGIPSRVAAEKFKNGDGDVLVGTAANYGEGLDLPRQIAPVIFFLRPGYPHPEDPATIFEEKRFRNMRWKIWNWKVMIESLQVRGRNIRSTTDIGVTFFISQQFRRFLFATLPDELEDAYRGQIGFDECVEETIQLLGQ